MALIRFTGKIHRDIKSEEDGSYIINYGDKKLRVSERYFTFNALDLEQIFNVVDFSQLESWKMSYDEFDDSDWTSSE